jgi:prevent-host-death family protein
MKIAPVAEFKARLSAYLKACEEGPVLVTRNGRAVAALIAVEDDEDLERLVLAHTPRLRAILETGRQEIRVTGGVRHADIWQDLEAESK